MGGGSHWFYILVYLSVIYKLSSLGRIRHGNRKAAPAFTDAAYEELRNNQKSFYADLIEVHIPQLQPYDKADVVHRDFILSHIRDIPCRLVIDKVL